VRQKDFFLFSGRLIRQAGWLAGFGRLSQHRQAQPPSTSSANIDKLSHRVKGFPRRPLAQIKNKRRNQLI
jgi:hypothetical protein